MANTVEVPDRYMVVHVKWSQTDVYIHNIYAPVQVADVLFLESFPRSFAPKCIHIVCGDFNSPPNPALDARTFDGAQCEQPPFPCMDMGSGCDRSLADPPP